MADHSSESLSKTLDNASRRYGVPLKMIKAIIELESSGNRWAMRYEPGYRWLWDVSEDAPYRGDSDSLPAPRGVSRPTELMGQRTSWGYMQVMGAVARELGFDDRFLSGLVDPATNLHYGCKHLASLHRRFYGTHGWEGVVAAYNAGSPRRRGDKWENQGYVDKVRRHGGFD